jgi:hypothetical protein
MNNKIKTALTIILALGIAWQTYQLYKLKNELNRLEKTGQLECKKR